MLPVNNSSHIASLNLHAAACRLNRCSYCRSQAPMEWIRPWPRTALVVVLDAIRAGRWLQTCCALLKYSSSLYATPGGKTEWRSSSSTQRNGSMQMCGGHLQSDTPGFSSYFGRRTRSPTTFAAIKRSSWHDGYVSANHQNLIRIDGVSWPYALCPEGAVVRSAI